MPIPLAVGRFNRRVTNRVTGMFAGRAPGFGILTHVGRRSGRTYHTPINVFRDGNDYVIVLTYGPGTDWLRNIEAAGGADLLTRGRHVRLTNPRLVTDPSMRFAPRLLRWIPRLAGVTQYVRLTPAAPRTTTGAEPAAK